MVTFSNASTANPVSELLCRLNVLETLDVPPKIGPSTTVTALFPMFLVNDIGDYIRSTIYTVSCVDSGQMVFAPIVLYQEVILVTTCASNDFFTYLAAEANL